MTYQSYFSSSTIREISVMAAAATIAYNVHPIAALQWVFQNVDGLYEYDNKYITPDEYMQQTFNCNYSDNTKDDQSLPGSLWTLIIDLLYMCEKYGYDIYELDDIMQQHCGWEYLACSGRHLCSEDVDNTALYIHLFLQKH